MKTVSSTFLLMVVSILAGCGSNTGSDSQSTNGGSGSPTNGGSSNPTPTVSSKGYRCSRPNNQYRPLLLFKGESPGEIPKTKSRNLLQLARS